MTRKKLLPKLHFLYEAAVQHPAGDLAFARRMFKKTRGREPQSLREDFCGTAALACDWVRSGANRRAWGVDLDRSVLDWGRKHNVTPLGPQAAQIELIHGDVLEIETPPADLLFAFNFSYCVFKTRTLLRRYFEQARRHLNPEGILLLDIYGGTESVVPKTEKRRIPGFTAPDGTRIPPFTYYWEQAEYDILSHHVRNHIHFQVPGMGRINRAFTYDWRLWTVPELRELLQEAGFSETRVYLHGWTENGESDGIYRRRVRAENAEGWIAHLTALR
jgi:SAM-dependent methyltransferase